jgi:hypothetical protein
LHSYADHYLPPKKSSREILKKLRIRDLRRCGMYALVEESSFREVVVLYSKEKSQDGALLKRRIKFEGGNR